MDKEKTKLILTDLLIEDLPNEIIAVTVQEILKSGRNQLALWYQDQEDNLSKSLSDTIVRAAVKHCRKERHYCICYFWIQKLPDREKLHKAVWDEERDFIMSYANSDPKLALNRVIETDYHSDYWISRILDIWFSSDSHAARNWYNQASKTLSPTQTDYVCMSFVRAAMKVNRLETAKKWGSKISQQSLIDKLEKEFTSAGIFSL